MAEERREAGGAERKPWETLEQARLPGGGVMTLRHCDGQYEIFVNEHDLMSSQVHSSEEALARYGCWDLRRAFRPRVLVGGLGLGYTLAAVLDELPPSATVVVAERVPEVVQWNHGVLGPLAGHPLDDPRVEVCIRDVAQVMREEDQAFDAILLDVDNGPFAPSIKGNRRLYSPRGVEVALRALRRDGILAIWSSTPDVPFQRMLQRMGLSVRTRIVGSGPGEPGSRHYLHLVVKR